MYKLFLSLRYLRRKYLALIAAAAVALCVAMVLIVVSVMDGFLNKIEYAARGLFGDIVVDSAGVGGIGRYDEFIAELTGWYRLDADFKPVEQASPADKSEPGKKLLFEAKASMAAIEALTGKLDFKSTRRFDAVAALFEDGRYLADVNGTITLLPDRRLQFLADVPDRDLPPGLIAVKRVRVKLGEGMKEIKSATPVIYSYGLLRIGSTYTETVQICGIRLPDRLEVTNFRKGLFVQSDSPYVWFDPPIEKLVDRSLEHLELIRKVRRSQLNLPGDKRDTELLSKIDVAENNAEQMLDRLEQIANLRRRLTVLNRQKWQLQRKPATQRDEQKLQRLTKQIDDIEKWLMDIYRPASKHLILGLGISGLSFRTPQGDTIRLVTPPRKVVLTLLPIGRGKIGTTVTPNTTTFTVIDDEKTDVYTVDSKTVYVPFDTLQELCDMTERRDVENPALVDPARCSQIQIKVRKPYTSRRALIAVRRSIDAAMHKFIDKHPDAVEVSPVVQTWYEKLSQFIGPFEKQRTLITTMFGIISFVAVLLIFAIFYMIVVQKTRDIGIIRAVGGSATGVAQIFLGFSIATAAIGSAVGLLGGYLFVHYINRIQDWIAAWFGFRVWQPDVFLFERIPNEVDPATAVVIAVWAIASGLVGALIPSVMAGVADPVEAIRYE